MKKSFVALLCIISSIAYGQEPDTTLENSLLWQVSGNGLTTPSYLFGTYHLLCRDKAVICGILEEKLDSSKTIFLEALLPGTKENEFMQDKSKKDLVGRWYIKQIKKLHPNL